LGFFLLCGNFNFCKQKKYHPPKQAQFCFFCLLQSDQLQWWFYLIFVTFSFILLLYFSVLFVDTIEYWEQPYLYYPKYSSLPPLCMLSHHSFNVWKKYRKKKFTKKDLKLKFWNVYGANIIVPPKKPQKNGMLKKYLIIPGATGKPTGILDSIFLPVSDTKLDIWPLCIQTSTPKKVIYIVHRIYFFLLYCNDKYIIIQVN